MKLLFVLRLLTYHLVCNSMKLIPARAMNFVSHEDPLDIIRGYGYPAAEHNVETSDGYILSLHRIPHGRRFNSNKMGITHFPVFLHHGFLGCSVDFLITGPQRGLAFILADLGFDVWMGNARGNAYSRAHRTLSPNDLEFWNYTWHDSAIYDLPAQIDFIRGLTNREKVIYMGFSMGTTMFMVLTSTLLEYNERIEVSFLMAPVAFMTNIRSPIIGTLVHLVPMIEFIDSNYPYRDFLPETPLFKLAEKVFCTTFNIWPHMCKHLVFLIVGDDPEEYDKEALNRYFDFFPAGYSTKAAIHYSQLSLSGDFRKFDYGIKGNILIYGRKTPPDYKLKNIKVPTFLYYGYNDYLATPPNVEKLASHLGSLKSMYLIKHKKFSHLDFLLAEHSKTLLYDRIVKDLKNFLQK